MQYNIMGSGVRWSKGPMATNTDRKVRVQNQLPTLLCHKSSPYNKLKRNI